MPQCRACLDFGEEGLIQFTVQTIFHYNLLTSLNISLYDGLPQKLCGNCFNVLSHFIEFKEKCITADSILRNVKEEQNIEKQQITEEIEGLNNVDVKDEYEEVSYGESSMSHFDDHESLEIGTYDDSLDVMPVRHTARRLKTRCKAKKLTIEKSTESYGCGLCTETYKSLKLLSIHLQGHESNRTCSICYEQFKVWPQLVLHRLNHLPKKNASCHICYQKFKESEHLKYHYIRSHFSEESLLLKCPDCGKTYKSVKSLRCHKWFMHSTKSYICDYCNKHYNNKQTLGSHIYGHHMRDKKYFCNQCDYSTHYTTNLKDHKLRRHTPHKIICQTCNRVFAGQTECDKHTCKKKLIICPICGKVLNKSVKYNSHLATHDKVGRFKCKRCPAVYRSSSGLKAHLNNHDGIRNKRCEYCDATFNQTSVLIKHRRIHTGEKPYVCKICLKGFTGNNNLKVHMRVHGEDLIVKKVLKDDNK